MPTWKRVRCLPLRIVPGPSLNDACPRLPPALWNHPLYLRDYSKKILRSALHNDSACAARHPSGLRPEPDLRVPAPAFA
jgi:hypothetical protein